MTFKFDVPVSLPRFTAEEFEVRKAAYVSKYGYEVHIPGFEEIIKWRVPNEPSFRELTFYHQKRVKILGEKRYLEIQELMQKKKARFLRMLGSPTPKIVRNVTSFMTAVDDVNDSLGTFAFIARVVAKRLPASLGKLLSGPAGWALQGAEITDMIMSLTRSPSKALRLQHELNHFSKDNPFTKKARLRRALKMKRIGMSKGELIEGLQTTDNIFGVGLCLGPIFALLYDIPAGLYHHAKGEKVSITGLPKPLLAFDRAWNRALKSAAYMWTGIDPALDDLMIESAPGFNMATQMAKSVLEDKSPVDLIEPLDGVEVEAPRPIHPSTISILEEGLEDPNKRVGWPHNDQTYASLPSIFDGNIDPIIDTIKKWEDREKNSIEGFVSAQNLSQSGLNILAMIDGDADIELDYDSSVMAILKLLNQNFRFPLDVTRKQGVCFFKEVEAHGDVGEELTYRELLDIAQDRCGLVFTTAVPGRPALTEEEEKLRRRTTLNPLRKWFVKKYLARWQSYAQDLTYGVPETFYGQYALFLKREQWLNYYEWPDGEPLKSFKKLPEITRVIMCNHTLNRSICPWEPHISVLGDTWRLYASKLQLPPDLSLLDTLPPDATPGQKYRLFLK